MEVENLVKICGKPKMTEAIRLPPAELYRHVEVRHFSFDYCLSS